MASLKSWHLYSSSSCCTANVHSWKRWIMRKSPDCAHSVQLSRRLPIMCKIMHAHNYTIPLLVAWDIKQLFSSSSCFGCTWNPLSIFLSPHFTNCVQVPFSSSSLLYHRFPGQYSCIVLHCYKICWRYTQKRRCLVQQTDTCTVLTMTLHVQNWQEDRRKYRTSAPNFSIGWS